MAALPLVAVGLSLAVAAGIAVSAVGATEEGPGRGDSTGDPYHVDLLRTPGVDGFGYRIRTGNRVMIRQPHVPGLSGRYVFATEADARSVAGLVVDRIRSGHMPPSVSREDLDSLGVSWIEGQ